MLRAALLLLSGNIATSGFLFARNLAVAALIPVEDYGIAATFALAMAAVEMASSFGLQQQIVQASDGDDPRLQNALTGFQVLRGAIAAIVLFALAGPLSTFLGIPQVAWAYQLLAVVPLLNALQHFDIHRLNRANRFGPLVATQAVPPAFSLLLIWPLAAWLGDWRVMLYALVIHAGVAALLSHVVAERPWRPTMDRALWSRTIRFGWPILLNAVVLFLVFQADKLAVGRILGLAPLGVFAMGVTLTMTPMMILTRTLQTASLPRLSSTPDATLPDRAAETLVIALAAGLALAVSGVLGGWAAGFVLAGTEWAPLAALLGPLAILQGVRTTKVGGNVVALSRGMTGNAILSNLPRVAALIAGIAALVQGADLLVLIWLGVAGEALGLVVTLWLVRRRIALRWPPLPILLATAGFALAALATALPWALAMALPVLPALLVIWRTGRDQAT